MFIVVVGFIIAIGRLILGSISNISDDVILLIMAIVNYIALGFVLLFLHNDIVTICYTKITEAGIDTAKKKKRRFITNTFSGIYLCIYCVVGILYLFLLKTSDMNDAISILALAISIATTELGIKIGNLHYKLIIKLSNFKLKKHSK